MLVQHVRDDNDEKIATLVGMQIDGKVVIGWSKRHPTDEPATFTKKIGRDEAKLRALDERSFIQRQAPPEHLRRKAEFEDATTVLCQVSRKGNCMVIPYALQFGALDRFIDKCKHVYQVEEISNIVE